jgi:hypothetical protein
MTGEEELSSEEEGKHCSFCPKVPMEKGSAADGRGFADDEVSGKMRVRRMVQSWLPDAKIRDPSACGGEKLTLFTQSL